MFFFDFFLQVFIGILIFAKTSHFLHERVHDDDEHHHLLSFLAVWRIRSLAIVVFLAETTPSSRSWRYRHRKCWEEERVSSLQQQTKSEKNMKQEEKEEVKRAFDGAGLSPEERVSGAKHKARRWLGQHFLIDHSVLIDAVRSADVKKEDVILGNWTRDWESHCGVVTDRV